MATPLPGPLVLALAPALLTACLSLPAAPGGLAGDAADGAAGDTGSAADAADAGDAPLADADGAPEAPAGDADASATPDVPPELPADVVVQCTTPGAAGGPCRVCGMEGFETKCLYGCEAGACLRPEAVGASWHGCVALDDRSVWCWGANDKSQLGAPTTGADDFRWPRRLDVPPAARVLVGDEHTAVLDEDGQIWCMGTNAAGQCAQGEVLVVEAPALVDLPGPATAIAGDGGDTTCARFADGSLWCWGPIHDGTWHSFQSITLDPPSSVVAAPIPGFGEGGMRVERLAMGSFTSCASVDDGHAIACWGSDAECQLGDGPGDGSAATPKVIWQDPDLEVLELAAGLSHFCAIVAPSGAPGDAGELLCWGTNANGAIGLTPPATCGEAPSPGPALPAAVRAVGLGARFTCALLADGAVSCWGSNKFGNLGHALGTFTHIPAEVPLPLPVAALGVGAGTACAVDAAAFVWCWGDGRKGLYGLPVLEPAHLNHPVPHLVVFP